MHLFIVFLYNIGKISATSNGYDDEKISRGDVLKSQNGKEILPPPPSPPRRNVPDRGPTAARAEEEDIFVGDGVEYSVPGKDMSQSPVSEDMEESPRNKERTSYFTEPTYGPVPPSDPSQGWQQVVSLLSFSSVLSLIKVHRSLLLTVLDMLLFGPLVCTLIFFC